MRLKKQHPGPRAEKTAKGYQWVFNTAKDPTHRGVLKLFLLVCGHQQ